MGLSGPACAAATRFHCCCLIGRHGSGQLYNMGNPNDIEDLFGDSISSESESSPNDDEFCDNELLAYLALISFSQLSRVVTGKGLEVHAAVYMGDS
uniref:Uncharacterized protein n=1 Tax=Oryza rufipogon TaxID=4529 RepID=A0A0E0N8Q6_ORYRU